MYKDWGLFLCLLLLALGFTVDAGSVLRRDTLQETLYIPLRLDQNNRYLVNVTMSTGSGQQTFNFALSTGTGYTVVAGTNCSTCNGAVSYNVSQSTTVQQLPSTQNVSLLDGTAGGPLIREDCHLTQSNGSAWIYNNQTIIVANQTQSLLSNGVAGIIGLGTNARNGDFGTTVYSGWLANHPGVTNFTFGMALNPPTPDSESDGGVLHWLAPDTAAYEGDLIWREMTPFDPSTEGPSVSTQTDWFVKLDSWSFTSGGNSALQNDGNLIAVIDPFESSLIFPRGAANMIYSSVQGAQLLNSAATPTNQWNVPCDAKMQLTLTFGSLNVTLTEEILVQQRGSICLGTIEQWSDSIFSVSGTNGSSIGIARRKTDTSSPSKFNGGIIAGIVLGGVAFLLMVIVTFILIRDMRKKRRRRSSLQPDPYRLYGSERIQQGYVNDFPSPNSVQTGFAANGHYASYHSSNPPSFPLAQPGLAYAQGYDSGLLSPPVTPPTDSQWDSSSRSPTTDAATPEQNEAKKSPWRQPGQVLAYVRRVPVGDSEFAPSPVATSSHGNEWPESENSPRMMVFTGRQSVGVPPPPYAHTEEASTSEVPSTSGEGSSRPSRSEGKRKKKRKVVLAS
ncbi:hypothetical protein D9758_007378 [Tetrapyrgos nigripes]|uniref:Peptidase A1 domain-containing protein n=1 Tax=Tetrapyrgos nigripes TaxID=182062 RepID=A0A8H5GAZ3_9AGAR|nr:hypothetical protein D9758_007378 [Tetrapyrgos nigripes]